MAFSKAQARKRRAMARALEKAAAELEQDAVRLRRQAELETSGAAWLETMSDIPQLLDQVRIWIAKGRSDADALAFVAETAGLPVGTLAHYLSEDERSRYGARKWRRDREIMRRAWAGASNKELAALTGLRAKSVSRIVAGKLRSGIAVALPWKSKQPGDHHASLPSPDLVAGLLDSSAR